MLDMLSSSYALGITLLSLAVLINKIKKKEGIDTDNISMDMLQKYLPKVTKETNDILNPEFLSQNAQLINDSNTPQIPNEDSKSEDIDNCIRRIKRQLESLDEDKSDSVSTIHIDHSNESDTTHSTNDTSTSHTDSRYDDRENARSHSTTDTSINHTSHSTTTNSVSCHCDDLPSPYNIDNCKQELIDTTKKIIINYHEKLAKCKLNKSKLETLVQDCCHKNHKLHEELVKCRGSLRALSDDKQHIVIKVKKFEEELVHLTRRYATLNSKYLEKSHELEKCRHDPRLINEIGCLQHSLKNHCHEECHLKRQIQQLQLCLAEYKRNKLVLLKTISKLEYKVKKLETDNRLLERHVEVLDNRISVLEKHVVMLEQQNKELRCENLNLKAQLDKTSKVLKIVFDKYICLKRKCQG